MGDKEVMFKLLEDNSKNMDMDGKYLILIGVSILLSGAGILFLQNDGAIGTPESQSGERVEFNLEGNTSDLNSLDFETSYIRIDNMYELDSPEIDLESETCLRFHNYSGSVTMDDKKLVGDAGGFETCTLNATMELTIDEYVEDMKKVSITDFESRRNFNLSVNNSEFITENFPTEIIKERTEISIRDYQGRLTLYRPDGIKMIGEGIVEVDGEKIKPD